MSKIDEYKNKINYDVWEDIYNMGNQTMPRESRSEYIVRKMQESRMEHTAPEEQKISRARNLTSDRLMYKTPSHLHEEINRLRSELESVKSAFSSAFTPP